MPIYLLTPRHLQAPDWKASTHRKPLQIEADNEDAARQRAARLFGIASHEGAKTRFNPWLQATLVRAKVVAVPDHAVLLKRLGDES